MAGSNWKPRRGKPAPLPGTPTVSLAAAIVLAVAAGGPAWAQAPASAPPTHSMASEGPRVVEVRIVGNQTIPRERIVPHIRSRAGRLFSPETIEADVRRLDQSQMFVTVRASAQEVPEGRIVIYEVVERPTLQYVKFVGNERVLTSTLAREAGLKAGDSFDTFAVEEARRRLTEFYRSKGHSKANVELLEGSRTEDRGVVFLINEGVRQRIGWVSFVGNTIASDARLRTQIESKPPLVYLFGGEVDLRKIDEDVKRLYDYYRELGFFLARIGREISFNDGGEWAQLTFVIDEGPRYHVREISAMGNSQIPGDRLLADLNLRSGQPFNQAEMNADLRGIQEQYGSIGYVFADIQASIRFLSEPGQLDIVYQVEEGERFRVGRVNVEILGENPHTRISTVLNRISLVPGDVMDTRKLRASERRIIASGLFKVDPASGVRPTIVVRPPELDDAQMAGRPRGHRGQSPEPPPRNPAEGRRPPHGSPPHRAGTPWPQRPGQTTGESPQPPAPPNGGPARPPSAQHAPESPEAPNGPPPRAAPRATAPRPFYVR